MVYGRGQRSHVGDIEWQLDMRHRAAPRHATPRRGRDCGSAKQRGERAAELIFYRAEITASAPLMYVFAMIGSCQLELRWE